MLCLSACGGGGADSATPTPTPEPVSPSNPPAADPPPSEPGPVSQTTPEDAARLLIQGAFGPTAEELERVVAIGAEAWIDDQLLKLPSSHSQATQRYFLRDEGARQEGAESPWRQHRITGWYDIAVNGEDQLRQRVAFALSQLFVVSDNGVLVDATQGLAIYYDGLAEHAFGNYRDLMEYVTLSPVMGIYLSMLGNEKPDEQNNIRPDENFARELMQLFTIGLTELEQNGEPKLDGNGQTIATYDLDTIKAYAHVFTGWHFNGTTEETWYDFWEHIDLAQSMTLVEAFHARDTEKVLLNGVVVAAGTDGRTALAMALDSLFGHTNLPPFVAKHLIQRLVTSNPSPEYVKRVADIFADNGEGVRGDLAAVVKGVLMDEEARAPVAMQDEAFGKVKEPILRGIQIWRAMGLYAPDGLSYQFPSYVHNQGPLSAPSVFNFFSPTYSPTGSLSQQGLVAPEFEILTDSYIVRNSNFATYWTLWAPDPDELDGFDEEAMTVDYRPYETAVEDFDTFLNDMDMLLMAGSMGDDMRAILTEYDEQYRDWLSPQERVRELVFMITTSPQFAVQR